MVVLVLKAGQTWPERLSERFLALLCRSVLSPEERCAPLGTRSCPSLDREVHYQGALSHSLCHTGLSPEDPALGKHWERVSSAQLCLKEPEAPMLFLSINKAGEKVPTLSDMRALIFVGSFKKIRIVEETNCFQSQESWVLNLALPLPWHNLQLSCLSPLFCSKGSSSSKSPAVC